MAENTENWTKLESDSRYPRKYEFEELETKVDNFQPLQSFTYKDTVADYDALSSLTGLEVGDGYVNAEDGLVYVWNGTSFPAEGDGLDVAMKPIGVVEEGNEFAVSGGEVYDSLKENIVFKENRFTNIGTGINKENGQEVSSTSTNTTDYIRINPNREYVAEGYEGASVSLVYFYDEYRNPISALSGLEVGDQEVNLNSENIPENAEYIRLTESLITPGNFSYSANILYNDKAENRDLELVRSTLFGGYFTVDGEGVNKNDGSFVLLPTISRTDFIKINGLSYKIEGLEGATAGLVYFYTKDKTPISSITLPEKRQSLVLDESNIPEGSHYFVVSAPRTMAAKIYVVSTQKSLIEYSESNVWNRNPYTLLGTGISTSSGLPISASSVRATDFIPFLPGDEILINGYEGGSVALCWFYDEVFNPISKLELPQGAQSVMIDSSNTPHGTRYIRSTGNNFSHSMELIGIQNNYLYNNKADKRELSILEDINLTKYSYEVQNETVNKVTGLIIDAGGVWRTSYIPLDGVYKALLRNVFEGTNAAAVYFFTKTRRPLGRLVLNNGVQDVVLNESNIPEGAGYFISTTQNGRVVDGTATVEVYTKNLPYQEKSASSASEYDSILRDATIRQSELAVEMAINSYVPAWYGVEWDEANANPELVTAIGSDISLHDTLPIQSKMRRCVVKDGNIQYYLFSDNSLFKEDGETPAILDGTDGDVMVEIPEFFYKVEEEGSLKRLKLSEEAIPGYNYSARRLTSAFEAIIGKDDKLYSNVQTDFIFSDTEIYIQSENNYVKSTASGFSLGMQKTATISGYKDTANNYYGGDGTEVYNDIIDVADTDVSRNCLGRPSSFLNRKIARRAAEIKGGGALMYTYDTHKALWMLSFVELKTRQYQKNVSDGGLGKGATVYPNYNAAHSFYSDMRAIIPTGVTLELGNNSGEVYYNMQNVPNSMPLGDWVDVWMPVNSYRGIENFYGHQYKSVDQINLRQYTVSGEGNERIDNLTYFYQRNPFLTDDSFDNFTENVGSYTFKSYIKNITELVLGKDAHILPKETGANAYTTHYCDCCELKLPLAETQVQLKEISFAGRYVSNTLCGPLFICSEGGERLDNPDYARACNVTRLDYILR